MYTCIHNMDLQPLKKTGYLANMCKAVVTTICQVSSQVMVMTWMVQGDTPWLRKPPCWVVWFDVLSSFQLYICMVLGQTLICVRKIKGLVGTLKLNVPGGFQSFPILLFWDDDSFSENGWWTVDLSVSRTSLGYNMVITWLYPHLPSLPCIISHHILYSYMFAYPIILHIRLYALLIDKLCHTLPYPIA